MKFKAAAHQSYLERSFILTLSGTQIATVIRSATARLPRKRFVGPFNSLDFIIDNIIALFPKKSSKHICNNNAFQSKSATCI